MMPGSTLPTTTPMNVLPGGLIVPTTITPAPHVRSSSVGSAMERGLVPVSAGSDQVNAAPGPMEAPIDTLARLAGMPAGPPTIPQRELMDTEVTTMLSLIHI